MVANRTQTQKVKARFGLVTQTQKVVIKGKKTEIQYTIFQISNLNFPLPTKISCWRLLKKLNWLPWEAIQFLKHEIEWQALSQDV